MTKPHAQAKSDRARPARSANQEDILPLEQMMAPEVSSNPETDTQSEPQQVSNDSKDNVLVPALRFEGFKDLWSIHLAETIGSWKSGTTPNRANKMYWDNGSVNWLKTGELLDHEVTSIEEHITQYAINSCSLRINPIGSVLVAMYGATAGKIGLLSIPSATNQACCACIVDPKKADNWFVFISFLVVRDGLLKTTDGSAQPNLNKQKIEQTKLIMPSLPEQQRIGALFKELDRNLSLNRAQLEKLTQLKTSMLEQMFPQEDEDVPRLRFDGFTEPWSQHVLGELGQVISGIAFPEMVQGGSEGIPFFKVSDMNLDGNEFIMCSANNYVTLDDIKLHNWRPIDGPAIFFAKVGAAIFLNRKRLVLSKFLLDNNTMAYIINTELLDRYFAFVMFGLLNLPSLVQNGALPSYGAKDVSSMLVKIPPLPEQKRIGAFFKALDERLALQRAKIEKLEQLKKALLEQMFV